MLKVISLEERVPMQASGQRLDLCAAELFPDYSREKLKDWIKSGKLTVNGQVLKPNAKVLGGEQLIVEAELEVQGDWLAQDVPFDVVFEDSSILVVNKPANLVVHPAAGNYEGTLLNGLLYRYPELSHIPRAGIVHRLDKDTTGLMVVARTLSAQAQLVEQLQGRSVSRQYLAVCVGLVPSEGLVDAAIGRDPGNRKKMAVVKSGGKEARTHYAVEQFLEAFSLVRLKLETGRTHQIRVHMHHLGYPLLGDPLYGKRVSKKLDISPVALEAVSAFPRQALHAQKLGLIHPESGEPQEWESDLPADMLQLIECLKR